MQSQSRVTSLPVTISIHYFHSTSKLVQPHLHYTIFARKSYRLQALLRNPRRMMGQVTQVTQVSQVTRMRILTLASLCTFKVLRTFRTLRILCTLASAEIGNYFTTCRSISLSSSQDKKSYFLSVTSDWWLGKIWFSSHFTNPSNHRHSHFHA